MATLNYGLWYDQLMLIPKFAATGKKLRTTQVEKLYGAAYYLPINSVWGVLPNTNRFWNIGPGLVAIMGIDPASSTSETYGLGLEVDGKVVHSASSMNANSDNYLIGNPWLEHHAGTGSGSTGQPGVTCIAFKRGFRVFGYQTGASTLNRMSMVYQTWDLVGI